MALVRKPLYGGLTRPATKWGITLEAFLFSVFTAGLIFNFTRNLWHLLAFPIFLGFSYVVERKEPRAFRLMYLWLITKASCHPHIRKFWGGATREPLPFRHQKESKRH